MEQPLFIYADYLPTATVTASDMFAGYPAASVLEANEDTSWKPANTTGSKILTFDLGISLSRGCVAIAGEYLRSVSLEIRAAENGFVTKTITGATKANPCALTIVGHGFMDGEQIKISNVGGMTQLNGNTYTVTVVDANMVTIGVNSTLYGTYTSGGQAENVGAQASAPSPISTYVTAYRKWGSLSGRYWRVIFSGHGPSFEIYHIAFSQADLLPWLSDGHDPDNYQTEGIHLISPDGHHLGSHQLRTMRHLSLDFGQLTDAEAVVFQRWGDKCVKTLQAFFYVPDSSQPICYFGWADAKYKFAAPYKKGLRDMAPIPFISRMA